MTKGSDAAAEIIELLGGSAGMKRLKLVDLKHLPDGVCCFWGELELKACIIISKDRGRFTIAVQHFKPYLFSTYDVPAEKVKSVLKWALIRKVPV